MAHEALVQGIPANLLQPFLQNDERLAAALKQAEQTRKEVAEEFGADVLHKEEKEVAADAQSGFANFYHPDVANRYVPVAANGPWIVTLRGAVLYDVGGYGMLGFGHNNPMLAKALARDQCMANIMTPSFSQKRFFDDLFIDLFFLQFFCSLSFVSFFPFYVLMSCPHIHIYVITFYSHPSRFGYWYCHAQTGVCLGGGLGGGLGIYWE